MLRIMFYLGFTLIYTLSHLVAGISLSGPSTDVIVNTTIVCQWTAESLEDPETFSLVMQFSDGKTDFGDHALITIIRRGNKPDGTMSNIPNVIHLGPHRLAAYTDPYDPTSQAFSVSPSFLVVLSSDTPTSSSDSTVSPIPTTRSTSTSSLKSSITLLSVSSSDSSLSHGTISSISSSITAVQSSIAVVQSSITVVQSSSFPFPSQLTNASAASSSSSANGSRLAIIIVVILLFAVLAGIVILLYLWRRKKQRKLLEVLRPRSFALTEDRSTYTRPSRGRQISFVTRKSTRRQTQRPDARTSRNPRSDLEQTIHELEALRAEMLRLTQPTSPPSYSAV